MSSPQAPPAPTLPLPPPPPTQAGMDRHAPLGSGRSSSSASSEAQARPDAKLRVPPKDPERPEQDVAFHPSAVKLRLLGPNARWADEVWRGAKAASALQFNRIWLLILASTVICDVAACVVYRTSTVVSGSLAGGIARYAIEAQIAAITLVDLAVRLMADGLRRCRQVTGALDMVLLAAMVACSFCDLFLAWQLPFTVYYLLRMIAEIRQVFDKVVDAAVDRKLIEALGDIFYILPDNVTSRPSDGFFVIEKTHLRPQAFADLHAPLTIKGGFVELAYIDLDAKLNVLRQDASSRRAVGRSDRSTTTSSALGTGKAEQDAEPDSQDSDTDSQDLEAGTAVVEERKSTRVNVTLRNVLVVLGPGKSLGKEAWRLDEICAHKDELVQMIARRTEQLVGRPRPKRESQVGQQPPTVLGRLRNLLHSGPLTTLDLTKVTVDIQNVEVRFEDFALLPRPMSCGAFVGNISMRLDSSNKNALRTRGFRAFPKWLHERRHGGEARPSRKYGGDSVDTVNDERRPPVRIACCVQPLVAWCDLWREGRDAFRDQSFTHLFGQEQPEISKLVRLFKRNVALRKLKLATVGALRPPDGDKDYPHHLVKERILNHRFVLLPLVISFHSMVVDARARIVTEEGELDSHPQQVSDLEVSQVAAQADRDQVVNVLKLVRMIHDWIQTDALISRKPHARLRDTPPRFQYGVAQDWWVYAVREIANGIAPGGKLAGYLGARRAAQSGEVYQQLLYERHCAAASTAKTTWQKRHILERYDEQLKSLQVTLPVSVIVRGRTMAKQWHLAVPQKVDLNDSMLRTALDSSIFTLKTLKRTKSLESAKAMFKSKSRSMMNMSFGMSSRHSKTSQSSRIVRLDHALKKQGTGMSGMAPAEARPRFSEAPQQRYEPSQAHIRVGRICAALLEPENERGIRKELVCLRVRGLSCVWTRAAPQDHFSQFQSNAANVLDHVNQGAPHVLYHGLQASTSSLVAAAGGSLGAGGVRPRLADAGGLSELLRGRLLPGAPRPAEPAQGHGQGPRRRCGEIFWSLAGRRQRHGLPQGGLLRRGAGHCG